MRNSSRPKLHPMAPRKSTLPVASSTAKTPSTGGKRPLLAKRIGGVSKGSEQEAPGANAEKPTESATQKQPASSKPIPQIPTSTRLKGGDSNAKPAPSKVVSLRETFSKWRPPGVTGVQRPGGPSLAKYGSSGGFPPKGRSGGAVTRRNSETAVGHAPLPQHSQNLNGRGVPVSSLLSTSSSNLGRPLRSSILQTTYASPGYIGRRLSGVDASRSGSLNGGAQKSRGSQDMLLREHRNFSLQDTIAGSKSMASPGLSQAADEGPLRACSAQSVSGYDARGLNLKGRLSRRYSAVGSRQSLYSKPSDLLSPQTSLLHHQSSLRRSLASIPSLSRKALLRTSPSLQQPAPHVSNTSEQSVEESRGDASGSGASTARSQEFGSPLISRLSETGSRTGRKDSNVADVAAAHSRNLPLLGGSRTPLLSIGRGSKEKFGSSAGSGPLSGVGGRLSRGGGVRPLSRRVPPLRAIPSNRPMAGGRFDSRRLTKLSSPSSPLSAHRLSSPTSRKDLSSNSSSRSHVVMRSEDSAPEAKALAKFPPKWLASTPSHIVPSTTGDSRDPRAALKTRLVPGRRAFWTGLVPTQAPAPASSSLVASVTPSPGRGEKNEGESRAVESPEAMEAEGLFLRRVVSRPTEASTITLESTQWKPLFVAPFAEDNEDVIGHSAPAWVEPLVSAEEKAREAVLASSAQLNSLKEGFSAGQLQRTEFPSNVIAAPDAFICRQTIFKGEFPITIKRGTLLHPSVYVAALEGPIHIGEDNVFSEFSEVINRSPDPLAIGHRNIVDAGVKILDGVTIGDDNHLETSCVVENYATVENECIIGTVSRVSGRTTKVKSKQVVVAGGDPIVSSTSDEDKRTVGLGACWKLTSRPCDQVVLEKRRTLLTFIRSTLLAA